MGSTKKYTRAVYFVAFNNPPPIQTKNLNVKNSAIWSTEEINNLDSLLSVSLNKQTSLNLVCCIALPVRALKEEEGLKSGSDLVSGGSTGITREYLAYIQYRVAYIQD